MVPAWILTNFLLAVGTGGRIVARGLTRRNCPGDKIGRLRRKNDNGLEDRKCTLGEPEHAFFSVGVPSTSQAPTDTRTNGSAAAFTMADVQIKNLQEEIASLNDKYSNAV